MLNKKRIVGFILVPLMLLTALPAWAGGGRELRGMDIIIGNFWEDYDVNTFQPANDLERRTLEYRRRVLNEHGFRMGYRHVASWGDMLQTASISIMAGQPVAQAFWLTPAWAMTLHRQGLIAPIQHAPVDFSAKRPGDGRVDWNQSVRNLFTFGGNTYGMGIGYGESLQASVIFFNKRLFREAGLDPELPYNMQRDRTWTWENFVPIARQLTRDINGDGIIDTWAMTADLSTYILDAIVSSNGANYVGRDSAGRFYNATGRPEFLASLQFAMRLRDEGVMMPPPEGAHWTWYQGMFTDGVVAMRVEPLYVRNNLQGMTDDWGMVMFPMGPNRNNFTVYSFENILVIPSTFPPEEVSRIVHAIDLWYRPVDESPYAWQDGLWHLFRDARAVTETMAIVRDPRLVMWQYHVMIPGLQRGHIAWEMWWHDGDPAQLVEAVSLAWNALIADANAALIAGQ